MIRINPDFKTATHRQVIGDLKSVNIGEAPVATELTCDRSAIHEELKRERRRHTVRVTSKLP